MDQVASEIDGILGLVFLTGLCVPGVAFAFGAIAAQIARGLMHLGFPKKIKIATQKPTLPWLIAESVAAGIATAVVARVIASISDMPFSPWGYIATLTELVALVFAIVFTGRGVDEIQAETPRDTNRNLYASGAALTGGAVFTAAILAVGAT